MNPASQTVFGGLTEFCDEFLSFLCLPCWFQTRVKQEPTPMLIFAFNPSTPISLRTSFNGKDSDTQAKGRRSRRPQIMELDNMQPCNPLMPSPVRPKPVPNPLSQRIILCQEISNYETHEAEEEDHLPPMPPLQESDILNSGEHIQTTSVAAQTDEVTPPETLKAASVGEKELAAFLLTLKNRTVSPADSEDTSTILATKMMETVHPHLQDLTFVSPPRAPGIPMAMKEDECWLSDIQCFIRSNCCEFFVADETDVKSTKKKKDSPTDASVASATTGSINSNNEETKKGGRRSPITVGRVGIRCIFCRDGLKKAVQSTSFPSQISGIYSAIVMMQCRHLPVCQFMPENMRRAFDDIKAGRTITPPLPDGLPAPQQSSNTPGRQQYWVDAAHRLGLTDTDDGIRFAPHVDPKALIAKAIEEAKSKAEKAENDKKGPPMNHFQPLGAAGGSFDSDAHSLVTASTTAGGSSAKEGGLATISHVTPDLVATGPDHLEVPDLTLPETLSDLMGDTDLVDSTDKDLIPDYLLLAMSQLQRCGLEEADRVGCYKERQIGFQGMSCKHCGGQAGFGRYFPASTRSLSQTTTSQTIFKHVGSKCRMCPPKIRRAIIALQAQEDNEKATYARGPVDDGRPRYGSRKVFFQRVWARLHGGEVPDLPTEEALSQYSAPNKSKSKKKSSTKSAKKKSKKQADEGVTKAPSFPPLPPLPRAGGIVPSVSVDSHEMRDPPSLGGVGHSLRTVSQSFENDSIDLEIRQTQLKEKAAPLTDDHGRKITIRVNARKVSEADLGVSSGAGTLPKSPHKRQVSADEFPTQKRMKC